MEPLSDLIHGGGGVVVHSAGTAFYQNGFCAHQKALFCQRFYVGFHIDGGGHIPTPGGQGIIADSVQHEAQFLEAGNEKVCIWQYAGKNLLPVGVACV